MLIVILFFAEAKSAVVLVSVTFAASGTPNVQLIFKVYNYARTLLSKQNHLNTCWLL